MAQAPDTSKRADVHTGQFPTRHKRPAGTSDRMFCLGAGSALALVGFLRGGGAGLLTAGLGGALLYRGVTGRPRVRKTLIGSTRREAEPSEFFERGVHVEEAFTIGKPAAELYRFWRDFRNLPRFMEHLEAVHVYADKRSHWIARAPRVAGGTIEWDAEIINDEPDHLIAWRSLPGSNIQHAGSVRFVPAPKDFGTEVRVVLEYLPPGGRVGRMVARLLGEEPQQQIREDLRRFKQIMETGEVPTTGGQPHGHCRGLSGA